MNLIRWIFALCFIFFALAIIEGVYLFQQGKENRALLLQVNAPQEVRSDTIYWTDTVYVVKKIYKPYQVSHTDTIPIGSEIFFYCLYDSTENEAVKTWYSVSGWGTVDSIEVKSQLKGIKSIHDTVFVDKPTQVPSKPKPFEIGLNGGLWTNGKFFIGTDFTLSNRWGVLMNYQPSGSAVAVGIRYKLY